MFSKVFEACHTALEQRGLSLKPFHFERRPWPCCLTGTQKGVITSHVIAAGSASDFVPLVNVGGRFQFLSNGTLWIEAALPYDESYYMCKAENGVGTPLSKTIFVAINGE